MYILHFVNAEIELLETLIKTCRAVRDPQRRGSRTELAIPAATWEMKFSERLNQLTTRKPKQKAEVAAQ